METILNFLSKLSNGPLTFEIETLTKYGGKAWEEVEVFTEEELQEVADMVLEYSEKGLLIQWSLI